MADPPNYEIIHHRLDQGNRLQPKRARWACNACHKRKVRCDAVDHGTPCCNCKLDHLECTKPERKKAPMRRPVPSSTQRLEHHAVPTPDADNEIQHDWHFRSTQRRRSPPWRRDQARACTEDEVARWLDLMPPQVLEGVRRHLTRGNCSTSRDDRDVDEEDGLKSQAQRHKDCYAKVSHAISLLQDVVSMYEAAEPAYNSQFSTACTAASSDLDGPICWNKDTPEDRFPVWLPNDSCAGGFTDIQTPESTIYMEESNLNLWLQTYSFPNMNFE